MSKRIYVPKPGEKGFVDPIIANKQKPTVGFVDPIIANKKPDEEFEVPLFQDKPVTKPGEEKP